MNMKALIYEGPEKLALKENEVPAPQEGEALLRVKACGICGSDVHGYLGITGRRLPGYAMGHEFSAVVETLGPEKSPQANSGTDVKVEDRVIVQPIDSCGHCSYCLEGNNNLCPDRRLMGVMDVQGAMAEYITVPRKLLIPMPDEMPFDVGALAEPYAVAYSAVKKIPDYAGKTVLVVGAGMIGLCILDMLKLERPDSIIISDLSDTRLERALAFGADYAINPGSRDYLNEIENITGGKMCDITIEAVGVEAAANQSIRALKKNGIAVWTGVSQHDITIDMHDVVTFQRTIIGSMNYTHGEFQETVKILESGALHTDELISAKVSLEEAADMFPLIHENPDDYLKVIIEP